MLNRLVVLVAIASLMAWGPLSAQEAGRGDGPDRGEPAEVGARPWPLLAAGGAVGGTVGAVGTFHLMLWALRGCEGGGCALPIVILPLGVEMIGVPLGVHLANGRRGELGLGIGASVLSGIAGLALWQKLDAWLEPSVGASNAMLLIVPAIQIGATVAAERLTSPRPPSPPRPVVCPHDGR